MLIYCSYDIIWLSNSRNDVVLLEDKKYLIDNQELMKEWDWEKNKLLEPSRLSYGSVQKIWWKCLKGHSWQASLNGRISKDRISTCPYCSNKKFLKGYNDLATMDSKLSKEWNYEKNKISSSNVLYGGHTQYWWKCSNGHEWKTSIIERKSGKGCPYCSNTKFKKRL